MKLKNATNTEIEKNQTLNIKIKLANMNNIEQYFKKFSFKIPRDNFWVN